MDWVDGPLLKERMYIFYVKGLGCRHPCAYILNSFSAEAKRQLLKAGFEQLNEEQEWAVQPGGRYFFTRNMSSIFAFGIGQK